MKTIPVYYVAYAFHTGGKWTPHIVVTRDPGEAEAQAELRRVDPKTWACVKVSGPHSHEIPE